MSIVIRKAQESDMESIHGLVMELAIYEKEPEAVTTTPAYYDQAFKDNIFEASVAEKDGEIVGMALYYMTFSTWKGRMLYLEDFVVKNELRGEGIGQLLFDEFLKQAKDKQCTMVKWQVLDWNEPAIRFYERNHAEIEKGWWNGKIIF